ncbi:MAG: hypothetical protein WAX89_07175 [Alphaproteobacteria bacterium]
MTINPIFYAIAAGSSLGMGFVFHKLASPHISQLLGAILVSGFAVCMGLLLFGFKGFPVSQLTYSWLGIVLILLAGLGAFGMDYFTLSAFNAGVPTSIGGPIIMGLSVVVPAAIGILFMGESFGLYKAMALAMVVVGITLLASMEQ